MVLYLDERDGDEGGIDIDMVPYYEQAIGNQGFQNATNAISAALADNIKENQQIQADSSVPKEHAVVNKDDLTEHLVPKQNLAQEVVKHEVCDTINGDSEKLIDDSSKEISCTLVEKTELQLLNNAQNDSIEDTLVHKSNIRTSWNSPDKCINEVRRVQLPRSTKRYEF